ncbi:tandem five-transmembrane protein [Gracilibacillus kekensis]|uniref:Tandem five-transmembrane protein n=2 Tax=Gracilibacillus kekensis TaxID=1027249 RepID=A0A1M7JNH3_9BACI|nr:DUF443 family protein [Gracilibacillus kekensis]SHM54659.1 tandem five-transmembrane protein [Gracilibacillus kekensis]
MNCEVRRVYNNIRFRMLDIDGDRFVMDMSRSVWNILIPFLTWIAPNTIYKIDKQVSDKKLQLLNNDPTNNNTNTVLTTGLALAIANLLSPLADYFNIQSTPKVNVIMASFVILIVVILRVYLSSKNKKKFNSVISYETNSKKLVWIRPKSLKQVIQCFLAYVFCLVFTIMCFWAFVQLGNVIMLFIATLSLLIVVISNTLTVLDGSTRVKFKKIS